MTNNLSDTHIDGMASWSFPSANRSFIQKLISFFKPDYQLNVECLLGTNMPIDNFPKPISELSKEAAVSNWNHYRSNQTVGLFDSKDAAELRGWREIAAAVQEHKNKVREELKTSFNQTKPNSPC